MTITIPAFLTSAASSLAEIARLSGSPSGSAVEQHSCIVLPPAGCFGTWIRMGSYWQCLCWMLYVKRSSNTKFNFLYAVWFHTSGFWDVDFRCLQSPSWRPPPKAVALRGSCRNPLPDWPSPVVTTARGCGKPGWGDHMLGRWEVWE